MTRCPRSGRVPRSIPSGPLRRCGRRRPIGRGAFSSARHTSSSPTPREPLTRTTSPGAQQLRQRRCRGGSASGDRVKLAVEALGDRLGQRSDRDQQIRRRRGRPARRARRGNRAHGARAPACRRARPPGGRRRPAAAVGRDPRGRRASTSGSRCSSHRSKSPRRATPPAVRGPGTARARRARSGSPRPRSRPRRRRGGCAADGPARTAPRARSSRPARSISTRCVARSGRAATSPPPPNVIVFRSHADAARAAARSRVRPRCRPEPALRSARPWRRRSPRPCRAARGAPARR